MQFKQITLDLPCFTGANAEIEAIVNHQQPIFLPTTDIDLSRVRALFSSALHMHQPTIPYEGRLINNLQYMFDHQGEGDNHNAEVFAWCYARMGDFIPELVNNGCSPRIMLDYSGNLLWGLEQMGREDILDKLRIITQDKRYQPYVEWLGTMWSHAVAPSTPIPDFKLHIQAWQHHFKHLFGGDALARVKGFSPPEMHLPNHPDTLYAYIKALKECGYRWLLVQEHTIERLDGQPLHHEDKYIPNCLVAQNSQGESISITVLVKTQGSDTKLVAQMQPYHEAKTKHHQLINHISVPPCVTQIADGENGGVMMNEFPRDYSPLWYNLKDSDVVGVNGTEYLELLASVGVNEDDMPRVRALGQYKIWDRVGDNINPDTVAEAIDFLQQNDHNFHTEGASWTNDLSWVKGYDNVLAPMTRLSALFHQKYDDLVAKDANVTKQSDYQEALLYNLLLQTSCFRYWGQGLWTDYAQELYHRGESVITNS
ncbi:MAG: glycosyl hydrolase family 57 [Cyanobacterium sp. T60_A2020_053]|nr:glycosyl hydrolase family 57 [Cyanobacterium sp. T60_A2020_053]